MIFGIGTDIIEIKRITKSIKNDNFINKVFSSEEIELFKKNNYRAQMIAANFCGKEAFAKSLGTGFRGFSLNEVSVLRTNSGKPYLKFTGNALNITLNQQLLFNISLSHVKEYAVAFVVAEKL